MNVKRFLSDTFRRDIDTRINRLVVNHKVNEAHNDSFLDMRSRDMLQGESQGTNIKAVHAAALYQEKCADLDLLPNPSAEKRFIEQFIGAINRKSLRFSGLGLGKRCMRCIVELFFMNPQLIYVDLSLNRLGDGGASIMGRYLLTDTPMIYVDLRSN